MAAIICMFLGPATAIAADAPEIAVSAHTVISGKFTYEIRLLHADGSLVRTLSTNGVAYSISWSPDDQTLAYTDLSGLVTQPVAGGPEKLVTPLFGSSGYLGDAVWSPTGDEIAYWDRKDSSTASTYSYASTLMAISADGLSRRAVAGPFVSGGPRGATLGPLSGMVPSSRGITWSPDGRKLAFGLSTYDNNVVVRNDLVEAPAAGGGASAPLVSADGSTYFAYPSYSPDGTRAAFVRNVAGNQAVVVRYLASGAETTLAPGLPAGGVGIGSQPWSPDSRRIGYIQTGTPLDPGSQGLTTTNADGSGGATTILTVASPSAFLDGYAWAHGPKPNLYIDRVEVAQAISPYGDAPSFPAQADPKAAVNDVDSDTRDVLVGYRDTFARVYVADEAKKGLIVPELKVRLIASVHGAEIGRVDLTEKDFEVLPTPGSARERQGQPFYTVNFVVPRAWTAEGKVDFSVVLDPDGAAKECAGCEKQGNLYNLHNVPFESGGTLRLFPYKIDLVWPRHHLLPPGISALRIPDLAMPLLPLASDGMVKEPWGTSPLVLSQDDPLLKIPNATACSAMLAKVEEIAFYTPAAKAGIVNRSIGYFSALPPVGAPVAFRSPGCAGIAHQPGDAFVVGTYQRDASDVNTFAHELGHTVGLPHSLCRNPVAPYAPDAPPQTLPYYPGIGGVGYRAGGVHGMTLIPAGAEDLMSYCTAGWTSPVTWQAMFTGLGGEYTAKGSARARQSVFTGVSGERAKKATPRLQLARQSLTPARRFAGRVLVVVGVVQGKHAQIINSYPLTGGATLPPTPTAADTIGRVQALDAKGHPFASAAIANAQADATTAAADAPQIFVAALPIGGATPETITVNRRNGTVLNRTRRSRHAPVLRLTGLAKSRKVARRRPLAVRWHASDADHDRLTYTVLIAVPRGGFRTAASDLRQTRTTLDLSAYKAGTRVRVRVIASDGLRFATATSARLIAH